MTTVCAFVLNLPRKEVNFKKNIKYVKYSENITFLKQGVLWPWNSD